MSEFKNDWYLVRINEKIEIDFKQFYVCVYSNGFQESEFIREFGKDIPSILTVERALESYKAMNEISLKKAIKSSH